MKDHYIVSVTRVPGVSRLRMKDYIEKAVSVWAGQFRPSNPQEICPRCYGNRLNRYTKEECSLCDGTGAIPSLDREEGDPLGPPCPLMEKGAVTVKMIPRKHERF